MSQKTRVWSKCISMSDSYWNEEIETMSAKAVERLESERLQTQMEYVYAKSAYFRAQFDKANVKPESFKHRTTWKNCLLWKSTRSLIHSWKAIFSVSTNAPLRKISSVFMRPEAPQADPCESVGQGGTLRTTVKWDHEPFGQMVADPLTWSLNA